MPRRCEGTDGADGCLIESVCAVCVCARAALRCVLRWLAGEVGRFRHGGKRSAKGKSEKNPRTACWAGVPAAFKHHRRHSALWPAKDCTPDQKKKAKAERNTSARYSMGWPRQFPARCSKIDCCHPLPSTHPPIRRRCIHPLPSLPRSQSRPCPCHFQRCARNRAAGLLVLAPGVTTHLSPLSTRCWPLTSRSD